MRRRLLLRLLGARWLRLEPGDLIVVNTPPAVGPKQAQAIAEELRRVLPVGVRALIIPKAMDVRKSTSGNVPPTVPPSAPADRR